MSATLLFCVEPMVAKMLLPLLGGAPAVWNTCLLFFQAALLGGYLYAHGLLRVLPPRGQLVVHGALVLLPLLVLPVVVDANAFTSLGANDNPIPRLLKVLTLVVGLPFFVLSTSAPLLQAWFSRADRELGKDPYFLYVGSNLGSMLALAAYPVVLEPIFGLGAQSRVWRIGYVVFALMVLGCVAMVWRAGSERTKDKDDEPKESTPAPSIPMSKLAWWILLAAIPSSLLLGVTTYATTDLVAMPLFWILPLAIYLLTFILVFARKEYIPRAFIVRSLPAIASLAVTLTLLDAMAPVWLLIGANLVLFFVASMLCHGELAGDRPDARRLTTFFLALSIGGVLGGLFNSLVAPVIFKRVYEYPLVIVAACAMLPGPKEKSTPRARALDVLIPLGLLGAALGAILLGKSATFVSVLALGLAAVANYATKERPLRFALGIGALYTVVAMHGYFSSKTRFVDRNFFGVVRVQDDEDTGRRAVVLGHTVHGAQWIDPAKHRECVGYFDRRGPVGDVFAGLSLGKVGVLGLGTGGLACYAEPGQAWTFYEISQPVIQVATDKSLFTYLSDAFPEGKGLTLEAGDGRLRLMQAAPAAYDAIFVDVFAAHAIPPHFITREAVKLYQEKLVPDGVIVWNITNRYLELRPPLAALAADASLVAYTRTDSGFSNEEVAQGRAATRWVVMAKKKETLERVVANGKWKELTAVPSARVWTDDFSNVLEAMKL